MPLCRCFWSQRFKLQQPALSGYRGLYAHHRFLVHLAPAIGIACIGLLPLTTPLRPSNQIAKGRLKQENLFQTALSLYVSTLMAGFYAGLNLTIHLRAASAA